MKFSFITKYPKLIYLFSLFIVQVYNIILLPIITTELDVIDYGNYIIIFQFIGFSQAILSLVYTGGIMKFWNELNSTDKIKYLNTVLFLLIIVFVGISLVGSPFIFSKNLTFSYFNNIQNDLLILMIIILFFRIINSFLLTFYRINIEPLKHFYYSIIFFFSISIQICFLYFKSQITLENILNIFLFSEIISSFYLLIRFKKYFKINFTPNLLFKHYRFSFTLILSTICFIIFQNLDRFILRINSGSLLFAQYSTALSISLISALIVTAISSSDFPFLKKISILKKQSKEIIRLKMSKSMNLMFLTSIILISSNDLILEIFAKKYHNVQTTLCLNLLVVNNFFRLKYLYNENNLFLLDKNKQILIVKAFILISGILFLNVLINKNPLLSFPISFIVTFILADFLSNAMIISKPFNFSTKDSKIYINGLILILISFILYFLKIHEISKGVYYSLKILFILISLIFLKRKIFEKINLLR